MWIFIVIGLVFWLIIFVGIGILLGRVVRHGDDEGANR